MSEHGKRGKLYDWMFTTDHKKIGILYLWTTFFFFVLGGLAILLVRIELATAGRTIMGPKLFNELFSIHGVTMIFLWIIPVLVGFGNYFVPLLIGAKDMAFPRLNSLGFWLIPPGGLLLWIGFFIDAQAALGWTGYAPLSSRVGPTGVATDVGSDLWLLGLHLLGIGSTLGGINFVVTVFRMRAPGITFHNMSLFVWAVVITSFMVVFATPSITAALTMLYFDRHFGTHFFNPVGGGDPVLYQHLFWFYSHPAVYIMILPAMGIISEVLPKMVKRPIFGYKAIAYSTAAIAFLGFTVWVHHMFTTGIDVRVRAGFMLTTMVIAVPSGVKVFNWCATMWGGQINAKAPTLFAIGFVALFTIGGIDGVFMASIPVDYQLQDTYWPVAHIHYVLFGGSVMGVFAGMYYWFPRMSGRMYNEKLALWHFILTFIAMNLTFMTMHFLGLNGMPRRVYDYLPALEGMNSFVTVSAMLLAVGQILFFYNFLWSLKNGKPVTGDPWGGWESIEWRSFEPKKRGYAVSNPPKASASGAPGK